MACGVRSPEPTLPNQGWGTLKFIYWPSIDREPQSKSPSSVKARSVFDFAQDEPVPLEAVTACYLSGALPLKRAVAPSSSSMRRSWLYLAMRSVRDAEPVLI